MFDADYLSNVRSDDDSRPSYGNSGYTGLSPDSEYDNDFQPSSSMPVEYCLVLPGGKNPEKMSSGRRLSNTEAEYCASPKSSIGSNHKVANVPKLGRRPPRVTTSVPFTLYKSTAKISGNSYSKRVGLNNALDYASDGHFALASNGSVVVYSTTSMGQLAWNTMAPLTLSHEFKKDEIDEAILFLGNEVDKLDAARFLFKYVPQARNPLAPAAYLRLDRWLQVLDNAGHRHYLFLWLEAWLEQKSVAEKKGMGKRFPRFDDWLGGYGGGVVPQTMLLIDQSGKRQITIDDLNKNRVYFVESAKELEQYRVKLVSDLSQSYDLFDLRKGKHLKELLYAKRNQLPSMSLSKDNFYKSLAKVNIMGSEDYSLFVHNLEKSPLVHTGTVMHQMTGTRDGEFYPRSDSDILIYVYGLDGRMYVAKPVDGRFTHMSFYGGRPVLAAGYAKFSNGKLDYIDNFSTDYMTPVRNFRKMLELMVVGGTNIQFATVKEYDPVKANTFRYAY